MSSGGLPTLAVTTETPAMVLGGTVNAVVTITGNLDHKTRGVKVQLVRTALHRYTNLDVVGHGSHDTLVHEQVVVTDVPINFVDGTVRPGRHVVGLHVPEDGVPSATDQVKWSVRATIDRRLGADVKAETPVEVLAGPDRFADEASSEARYKGERCMELELSNRTVRPGESITGSVILRPTRAMTVTEVVVTFAVTIPVKKGLEGEAVAPRLLLEKALELRPGDTTNLPFELTLPNDAAPTVRGSLTTPPCHSVVSWDVAVEAKADLSGNDKTSVQGFAYLGINVYNTGVASPAAPGEV